MLLSVDMINIFHQWTW